MDAEAAAAEVAEFYANYGARDGSGLRTKDMWLEARRSLVEELKKSVLGQEIMGSFTGEADAAATASDADGPAGGVVSSEGQSAGLPRRGAREDRGVANQMASLFGAAAGPSLLGHQASDLNDFQTSLATLTGHRGFSGSSSRGNNPRRGRPPSEADPK